MNTSFVIVDCKTNMVTVIDNKQFIAQYKIGIENTPADIEYVRTYREDEAFDPCI